MSGGPRITVVGYASLDCSSNVAEFRGVDATSILSARFLATEPDAGGVAHLTGALAAAGHTVDAVTWLAPDRFGVRWTAAVSGQGTGTGGVAVSGTRSPSAWLVHIGTGGSLCFFDPGDCHPEELDARQRDIIAGSDWVLLTVAPRRITGAVLAALSPGARLVWAVKRDEDAYPEDLVRALLERADVISFSAGERPWVSVDGIPPESRAHAGALVVETRGAEGVTFAVAPAAGTAVAEDVPVQRVAASDTTGAGDTFLGALVAGLAQQPPPDRLDPAALRDLVADAAAAVGALLRRRESTRTTGTTSKESSP